MALIEDKLSRKAQAKIKNRQDIEDQINRLDDDIRRLKIEFDIFFNGGTRSAPLQSKASLEARIKRINGNRELTYADRYKLNAIISRYTSYRELWRRRLKVMGDDPF